MSERFAPKAEWKVEEELTSSGSRRYFAALYVDGKLQTRITTGIDKGFGEGAWRRVHVLMDALTAPRDSRDAPDSE